MKHEKQQDKISDMAVIRADSMDSCIATFFGNTRELLLLRPIVNEEVISIRCRYSVPIACLVILRNVKSYRFFALTGTYIVTMILKKEKLTT